MQILEPFEYKDHRIKLCKCDDVFVYSVHGPFIDRKYVSGRSAGKPKTIVAYFKGLVDKAHKEFMIDKFFDKKINMKP